MPTTDKPKNVLESMFKWSQKRPLWQRDALRRIVLDGRPDDEAVDEILSLCKKEHGDDSITIAAVPLMADDLPVDPGEGESISLVTLSDVVGVNQLAANQTLAFEKCGLTVIYGPNGAGKSGYARILKKACRARHAGEIMPDIYQPSPTGNATANIVVSDANGDEENVSWEDGEPRSDKLSAITVFDRDCASVHVREKNSVLFRPFGLDVPDELAALSQVLKDRLTAEKNLLEQTRASIFSNPTWHERTVVGRMMSTLKATSDLTLLDNIEPLDDEKEQRLNALQKDLSQDPTKASAEQTRRATRIEKLKTQLKHIATISSDEAFLNVVTKAQTAKAKREAANAAAEHAFGDLDIDGVGTPVWKALWDSAKNYASSLDSDVRLFPPNEGQACVLCHQEIKPEAAKRMQGFEEFIQKDTERLAADAEKEAQVTKSNFESFRIDASILQSIRDIVADSDLALAKSIRRFLASARLRYVQTKKLIETPQDHPSLPPAEPLPEAALDALIASVRTYAASLSASVDHEGRKKLEQELAELLDTRNAAELYIIAVAEVERLKKLVRVQACLKEMSTAAITKLGNGIADDLITPLMQDRFQQEIVALADNRVRVKIERSGGKFGSPQYEVRLFASPSAKVENVLSEGEQTCVALASYLTELANASHNSALVFDDPVTSLDHNWRSSVADRLSDEANIRQVVVFTHDLVFVNDLHQLAKDKSIPVKLANLGRGLNGVGLVSNNLPWEAASMRHRIDDLEKDARTARKLFDAQDDEGFRSAAYDFYAKLRSTWERGVEDVLFSGVVLRHRDYVNLKGLDRVAALTQADIQAIVSGFDKCSGHIKGHDPSRGRNALSPKPSDMLADIEALKNWEEDLRKRQNLAAKHSQAAKSGSSS